MKPLVSPRSHGTLRPPPDMFKLVHLGTPLLRPLEVFKRVRLGTQPPAPILPLDVFKLVHYVALTFVRKRAVAIPLKCLLVLIWTYKLLPDISTLFNGADVTLIAALRRHASPNRKYLIHIYIYYYEETKNKTSLFFREVKFFLNDMFTWPSDTAAVSIWIHIYTTILW